jgi:hypothetical protein
VQLHRKMGKCSCCSCLRRCQRDIVCQRIAVTDEQIEEFNLPPMPESKETIDKVNHDTRKEGFIKKYGKLYIVELDAFSH